MIFRRRDGSSSGPLRLVKTRALAFGEIRVYIRTERKGLPLPKKGVTLAPGATGHMEDDFFDLPGLTDGSSDSSDSDEDDGGSSVRSRREKWRRHQEQIRADGEGLFGRGWAQPQQGRKRRPFEAPGSRNARFAGQFPAKDDHKPHGGRLHPPHTRHPS